MSNKYEEKIITYDIEAENWSDFRLGGIYDGNDFFYTSSKEEYLKRFIITAKQLRKERKTAIFYAHNAGKYDIRFILPYLAENFTLSILPIGSAIVNVKVYNGKKKVCEFRDSLPILPGALKNLAQDFNVTRKRGDVDVTRLWDYTDEEILPYLKADCVALYELLHKRMEMTGVSSLRVTVASEAIHDWKETNKGTQYDERALRLDAKHDPFIREALHGGRTELFKFYGKNLRYYDVNSMYPGVMLKKEFPVGSPYMTTRFIEGKLGYYRAVVHVPWMKYPPLPCTHNAGNGEKLFFPCGTWEGVFTSVELEYLRKLGGDFIIKHGLVWSGRGRPFKKYVEKWHKIKTRAKREKRPALKYIAKLHLNSLFGKLVQRRKFRKVRQGLQTWMKDRNAHLISEDLDIWSYEEDEKKPYCYTHLGTFITAYSRIELHKGMMEIERKGGEVYYCDTDSLTTDGVMTTGEEIGEWELEHEIKEGIFILPKVYALRTDDDSVIIHAKGLNSERLCWGDFQLALKGDMSGLYYEETKLAGIFESARRGISMLQTIHHSRHIKHQYDKRKRVGKYDTNPITI